MTKKKKKVRGLSTVAAEVHPELLHLTDKISRLYHLNNGKTALYWNLVAIIDLHVKKDSIKKLHK